MEKTKKEIFDEINLMVEDIKARLAKVEELVAQYNSVPETVDEEAVEVWPADIEYGEPEEENVPTESEVGQEQAEEVVLDIPDIVDPLSQIYPDLAPETPVTPEAPVTPESPVTPDASDGTVAPVEVPVISEVPVAPVDAPVAPEAVSEPEDIFSFMTEGSDEGTLNARHRSRTKKAVLDVMATKESWRTDRPGSPVKDVRSAISLNDRIIFIRQLFKEDPMAFQGTVAAINGMDSLEDVISYLRKIYPDWNYDSDTVYRFMMAVRRKIG